MILERTNDKGRVVFWVSRGFIEAEYNDDGYIEVGE